MSLPPDIRPNEIKNVLKKIDSGELQIPPSRVIRKFEIRDHGLKYPPKFVISHAGKPVIPANQFGGGIEANNFLIRWGFEIWNNHTNQSVGIESVSEDDEKSFPEGKKKYRLHRTSERNPIVAKTAKNQRLAKCGELLCDVCGFSFREKYGDVGDGFIEAHHTVPVSELRRGAVTKIADIALVCSNCHRMLHRKRPWLCISQLRSLLKISK